MTRLVGPFARAVVTAGILSAFAAPLPTASASPNQFAQATPAPAQAQAPAPAPAQAPAPAAPAQATPRPTQPGRMAPRHQAMHSAAHTRPQLVEGMISGMRAKLHITAAEQPQFDAVADVMRANARAMETLLAARAHDTDRSAVASLQWYERLTEAHAAALKNFTPAFDTLYATLSESQRKAADAMFLQLAERPFTPKSR